MPLMDVFWTMFAFFIWIAWIWVLVSVLTDVFRSNDLSGWAKALWVLFVIFAPWLGVVVYLIARGSGMSERAYEVAAKREKAAGDYIHYAAGSASTANELTKLAALKDSGAISDAEFETEKAKLLI